MWFSIAGLGITIFMVVGCCVLYCWVVGGSDGTLRVSVCSFECGFLGQPSVENMFSYTYFALLVFFVVFDLEISLLLNIPFQGLLFDNYVYYFIFILLVGFGYFVEVHEGYASWVS